MILQHGTLEISEARLRHNVALLQAKLPPRTLLCALLKADAYGHSAVHLDTLLRRAGVPWRCLYNIQEAVRIASLPPPGASRVLALAPLVCRPEGPSAQTQELLAAALLAGVRLTLVDRASATFLNALAGSLPRPPAPVHVQIDTGLTRSGVGVAQGTDLIRHLLTLPHLQLEGLYTHLSHGDEPDHPSIGDQVRTLHAVADPFKRDHPHLLLHAQNSGGAWHFSDTALDMVRIGIALYGLQPSLDNPLPGLQPVARLVAPILMLHERPAGVGVGYGHTFRTGRPSRLAIVPVGYADGYPRALSNCGIVQVRGQSAPVVGRVSMDQIIIDVTDVPAATVGDQVVVFSDDPTLPNAIDQVGRTCGTIGYEIATGLGPRLDRQIVR